MLIECNFNSDLREIFFQEDYELEERRMFQTEEEQEYCKQMLYEELWKELS